MFCSAPAVGGKSLKPIDEEINRENYLGSYSTFEGSPLSKGLFQLDLWNNDEILDYILPIKCDDKKIDVNVITMDLTNISDHLPIKGIIKKV